MFCIGVILREVRATRLCGFVRVARNEKFGSGWRGGVYDVREWNACRAADFGSMSFRVEPAMGFAF